MFFDTEKKARELGIQPEVYQKLKEEVKSEFPNDEMMFELHLLRALMEYSRTNLEMPCAEQQST